MNPPDTITPNANAALTPAEPPYLARARRILSGDIRPNDYLPMTPEVRHRVDLSMEWARARAKGQPLPPDDQPQQIRQELLSFHHGGDILSYVEDEHGVIVLAVGHDQLEVVLREFGPLVREPLNVITPFEW